MWVPETRWDIQDLFTSQNELLSGYAALDLEEKSGFRYFERRPELADEAGGQEYRKTSSERVRAWQKRFPEKKNAVMRAYRERHKERLKAATQTPEARAAKAARQREYRARARAKSRGL